MITLEGEEMSLDKKAGRAAVDAYIDRFPKDVQKLLRQMRLAIRKAAPKAIERISYGIPTFYQDGNLVHFAAFKSHIGFYPAPGKK
jgi:uncharacterized protein YdhG (YjbR/CyaY superfamily)